MDERVFISHSAADKAVADAVCARLESAGVRCWIAPRDITPGRMWSEAIIDGINASRLMILIFSHHSNKSPQVSREIERAVNRGMPLLQVRLEDIRPSRALELFISSSQWLDAFPPPAEGHLDGLPAAVERLIEESVPTEEREAQADHSQIRIKKPSKVKPYASRRTLRASAMVLGGALLGVVAFNSKRWLRPFNDPPASPAPVLTIGKTSATRQVGDTFALQVTLVGSSDSARSSVRWRSSDSTIVRINAGDSVFRAIAPGTALLYATAGEARDSVQVRVLAAPVDPGPANPGKVAGSIARGSAPKSDRSRSVSAPPTGISRTPVNTNAAPRDSQAKPTTGVRDTQVKANLPARDPQLNPNTASRESLVKPNVADSPNATLVAFARRCIEALRAKDGPWLTEHYGTTETIADKDNLGRLSAMIRKKGYTAEVLTAPHSAEGAAEFKMEFAYSGAFGPTLKTTADFLVNPGESAAVPNAVRCRVKGTLRTP